MQSHDFGIRGDGALRAKAGQIRYADNPVIVYEGDSFQFGEQNGRKIVNFMSAFPRTSNHIIACFIKITRADGSEDYSVMTEQDWERLKGYSAKNNTYYDPSTRQRVSKANALYDVNGQIDTGFLMAKCIKHAFKTYPKLKIGKGSSLETEINDRQDEFDPYGGVGEEKEETFAAEKDMSAGVTVNPAQGKDEDDWAF